MKGSIFDNQTDILRWLKSRGHEVVGLGDADDRGRHKRRSCESKRRFETREAALMLEAHMDVYRCRYCGGYHLTTPR